MTLPPVVLPAVPAPSLGFTDRYCSSVMVKPYTSLSLIPYAEEDSSQGSRLAPPKDIVSDPSTLEGSTALSTTASFESVLLSPIIESVSLDTLRSTVESTTGTFDTDSFLGPDDAAEGDDNGYACKEVALEKSVAFLMNFSGTTKLKPPVKDASVDTAVIVTSPSVSTANYTSDVDDDHYARKEVALEKSVAFLMNFSGTKDKLQVRHEDFDPHAQDISVSTAVADAASGSSSRMQVSLAPVENPTSGQDESVSITPDFELQSVHLLDPLTFAVDPDLESDEDFCEYNQVDLEVTVAVFLRDFSAERTVKVTESDDQSQGLAAEYVQPIPTSSTPLEGSASPPPPTVSRSRFVPARTALGSYRTPTRSSSLKSIVSNKPNVAKVGRSGKPKADSPSKAKAGGANVAKENLKDSDSGRSKLARARVMVKRPSRL